MPTLRILHLEDDPADAALVAALLADEGLACAITRTATREQFVAALDGEYDLVLADFAIPGFDGISAQRLALERHPDVPFVFVSGTMGEEVAIERLKAGATDYVLKQRLQRLPSAVRRALDEARDRRERHRAENEVRLLNAELEQRVVDRTAQLAAVNQDLHAREVELQDAKAFLEQLIASSPSMIFRFEPDGLKATYVSPNVGWLLGYTATAAGARTAGTAGSSTCCASSTTPTRARPAYWATRSTSRSARPPRRRRASRNSSPNARTAPRACSCRG